MKTFQIILNFVTTFLIIGAGAFSVAVAAAAGQMPNAMSLGLVFLTAAAAAAKETRSFMGLPPLSNGNYTAIAQLLRDSNKAQAGRDYVASLTPAKEGDAQNKTP